MRTCKIKPTASECYMCGEAADYVGTVPNCAICEERAKRYELIGVESGFFADHAFVLMDGEIKKVSLGRIYDVKGAINETQTD
ncbi:MAG: hypothetical protein IJY93_04250 [Clostridia bacterium]|nr:hypothetical protein [Clostridia bacterium]